MDARSVYPFVAAYGFKQTNGFTFLLPGREVTIEGADEILPTLLMQSNGYQSLEEILVFTSERTGYDKEELRQLVSTLLIRRILIDVPRYYELFHEVSTNPMPFLRNLSEEDPARMLREGESPLVPFSSSPCTVLEQLLEKRE